MIRQRLCATCRYYYRPVFGNDKQMRFVVRCKGVSHSLRHSDAGVKLGLDLIATWYASVVRSRLVQSRTETEQGSLSLPRASRRLAVALVRGRV